MSLKPALTEVLFLSVLWLWFGLQQGTSAEPHLQLWHTFFFPWVDCNVSPTFSNFIQAGKFDIIPTMTTIGSGIGIFGVVSSDISSLYTETLKLFSLPVTSMGKCP